MKPKKSPETLSCEVKANQALFRALYDELPMETRQFANKAYRQFLVDTTHPGLDFKQVSARGPTYSVRIGMHYRALAIKNADHWLWFWIGSHAEYDRMMSQL